MDGKSSSKRPLFEEESLDKLSSPEQIDRLMVVITSKGWMALISLFILIFSLILWSIMGNLPVLITGTGITMTNRGTFNIASSQSGIISEFPAIVGDWITPETLIAKLSNDPLYSQLKIVDSNLEVLKLILEKSKNKTKENVLNIIQEYQTALVNESKETYRNNLTKTDSSGCFDITAIEQQLLLWNKEALLNALLLKLEESPSIEVTALLEKEEIETEQKLYTLLQEQTSLNIYSSSKGQILETFYAAGDWVNAGDILAWVKYPLERGESHFFYTFLPIDEGQKVKAGMEAEIALENINTQMYGYLKGTVVEVAEFPSSDKALARGMHNLQIVDLMKKGAPTVMRVVIHPLIDPNTFSGYQWTTKEGPPEFVRAGTVINAKITVTTRKPISYLLPLLFTKKESKENINPDVVPQ